MPVKTPSRAHAHARTYAEQRAFAWCMCDVSAHATERARALLCAQDGTWDETYEQIAQKEMAILDNLVSGAS